MTKKTAADWWHARTTALIHARKPNQGGINKSILGTLGSILGTVAHVLYYPEIQEARALVGAARFLASHLQSVADGIKRVFAKVKKELFEYLYKYINARIRRLQGQIRVMYHQLVALIRREIRNARLYARALVAIETTLRQRAVRRAEADTRKRVKWLHQAIEREAASAYRQGFTGRQGVITDLADFIAVYNPETRALVKTLVTGVLDLASVDNPVARIVLGFVIRHIIDKIGIDHVVGQLIQSLLKPLIGQPRPRDLPGVIADISARLGALEQQWADFMKHGGPEILQAGDEWQNMRSAIIDVALLGFFGLAVAEPTAWARDVSGIFSTVVDDTLIAAAKFIGKG